MDLFELIRNLKTDTMDYSLGAFAPELVLCGTIVALLLAKLFRATRGTNPAWITLAGSVAALCLLAGRVGGTIAPREIFMGMMVYDGFGLFVRILLVLFLALFTILILLTKNPKKGGATDFFVLVLGATVGMCTMASANHMLIVFLGVEMAGVPCYVLAGFRRKDRRGSEASLKYAIYGAAAAGVMLFGISLVTGVLGSFKLGEMACHLAQIGPDLAKDSGLQMALVLGGVMIAVGLMFKLSAVPLHFWLPDVFEGATAEVNAFLSVAAKTAALALLVRVAFGIGGIPLYETANCEKTARSISVASAEQPEEEIDTSFTQKSDATTPVNRETTIEQLSSARTFMGLLLAVVAAITCTFGNLAAYAQNNIKRMLAYSTIAHAGYMMAAVPAALELYGTSPEGSQAAVAGLLIYMTAYLFMNFGAFAVVALVRDGMGTEEIPDYAGLVQRRPGLVVCFSLMLFSLVGLPPLAGFIGKLVVFASLAQGWAAADANYLLALLIIGGLNTAISLFYYLRVVKLMTINEPSEKVLAEETKVPEMKSVAGVFILVITIPTALMIFGWGPLQSLAMRACEVFR